VSRGGAGSSKKAHKHEHDDEKDDEHAHADSEEVAAKKTAESAEEKAAASSANGSSAAGEKKQSASSSSSSAASSNGIVAPTGPDWDPYPVRLHQILHVVTESITSNALYFRPMEPAKCLALELLDRVEEALRAHNIILLPEADSLARFGLPPEVAWRDDHGAFEMPLLTFVGMGTQQGQDAFFTHMRTVVEPNAVKLRELGYPRRINTPKW